MDCVVLAGGRPKPGDALWDEARGRPKAPIDCWSDIPLVTAPMLGRLSMAGLERHLERRFGLRCRTGIADDPELGLDVDSPANLAVCREALAARTQTA